MRLGSALLAALAACSSDVTLSLELHPETASGTLALIQQVGSVRTLTVQPVGEPVPGVRFDASEPFSLEALVWLESPQTLGGLRLAPPEGAPAPRPRLAFRADLDEQTWKLLPSVDALAQSVVLERPSACAQLVATQYSVPLQSLRGAIAGVLPVSPDRVVFVFPNALLVATSTGVTELPGPIERMSTAALAPDGTAWVTTSTAVWRGAWNGRSLDLTLVGEHERRVPLALAASDDELLELSYDGKLRRFAQGTWTLIHEFDVPISNDGRGSVVYFGDGEFAAGVASDPVFLRWENGQGRTARIDDGAEGPVSFARRSDLGLVAGTGLGHLVAESLNYAPVPETGATLPVGTDVFVLAPFGDDLVVAGELGFIGLWTEGREFCEAMGLGGARQRYWAPLGDGIAIGGHTRGGVSGAAVVTTVAFAR